MSPKRLSEDAIKCGRTIKSMILSPSQPGRGPGAPNHFAQGGTYTPAEAAVAVDRA